MTSSPCRDRPDSLTQGSLDHQPFEFVDQTNTDRHHAPQTRLADIDNEQQKPELRPHQGRELDRSSFLKTFYGRIERQENQYITLRVDVAARYRRSCWERIECQNAAGSEISAVQLAASESSPRAQP
eukprot:343287-Pleurochrysis_carterae.AAC.4